MLRFFVKFTGFLPYIIVFRTRTFFVNKKKQSRKLKGPALIVSNHRSVWDYALIMYTFFWNNFKTLAAEILFERFGIFKFFLKILGCVKVDRKTYDFSFIKNGEDILKENKVLLTFPEGRIPDKNEEKPLEFRTSTVYIALETNVPIIPFYSDGNYFCKKRLNAIVGEPLYLKDYYDENKSFKQNVNDLNILLRNKIMELGNELEERKKRNI